MCACVFNERKMIVFLVDFMMEILLWIASCVWFWNLPLSLQFHTTHALILQWWTWNWFIWHNILHLTCLLLSIENRQKCVSLHWANEKTFSLDVWICVCVCVWRVANKRYKNESHQFDILCINISILVIVNATKYSHPSNT